MDNSPQSLFTSDNELTPKESYILDSVKEALKNHNRNMPCLCGSGKKYKKCCRNMHKAKLEAYKKDKGLS